MARGLRVCLCFGTFPPERNGGADFLARFSRSLAGLGHEVTVLTSPAAAPRRELVSGVTVHRTIDDWTLGRRGRQALRSANRLLSEEGVDVVHVFFPDPGLGGRYQLPAALGAGRIPLVTTFWNLGVGRRSPWPLRLQALALLARSSVLTSHDPTYLAALRSLSAGLRPVHWLPVGNNLDGPRGRRPSAEVRDGLGVAPSAALLAYFGHLDFTRGVEELFTALRIVRRAHDARLVMVGSAEGERRYDAELRSLPGRLGLDDAIHWTGYLSTERAADALAAADLCVLPYRRNSLGRSALAAALELGVPTVLAGTRAGIAPLRAGTHVALARPGDAQALAATVADLLRHPRERDRLAAGARRAAHLFAWDRIAASAEGIYRRALAAS